MFTLPSATSMNLPFHKSRGFTLIELMIVVAIVGILAAVAYPSYVESVRKSRRADGQAAMMDLVQVLERFYTVNNTYTGAALPYNVSPQTGTKYYDLSVALAANTYTLTATPAGTQSSDGCGTMTVNQAGAKTAAKTGCWN